MILGRNPYQIQIQDHGYLEKAAEKLPAALVKNVRRGSAIEYAAQPVIDEESGVCSPCPESISIKNQKWMLI
jgi:hypothetical protein